MRPPMPRESLTSWSNALMRKTSIGVILLVLILPSASAHAQTPSQKEVQDHIRVLKTVKKPDERAFAITRLAELEMVRRGLAKEATPLIAKALQDGDAKVRAAAAHALGV